MKTKPGRFLSRNPAADLLGIWIVTVLTVDMIETCKAFYTNWTMKVANMIQVWFKKNRFETLFEINYRRKRLQVGKQIRTLNSSQKG